MEARESFPHHTQAWESISCEEYGEVGVPKKGLGGGKVKSPSLLSPKHNIHFFSAMLSSQINYLFRATSWGIYSDAIHNTTVEHLLAFIV